MQKNNSLLVSSLEIPNFKDIHELSSLMGLSSSLIFCLTTNQERYYKELKISKKNGGFRTLHIPTYSLKIIQKWILVNILNKIKPSDYAMAFRKGNQFGCKPNAVLHKDTLYGVSLDLKDFYPSITAKRVFNIFLRIGYSELSATILTNLCVVENQLPQGSICSPTLSNLVCLNLDKRLSGLCEKRGIRFSRYDDDIYFSCDNRDMLMKSVKMIRKIISSEGFAVNEDKFHYHTPSNKKMVNGITIARDRDKTILKANKLYKRKIRAEIYSMIITGDYTNKNKILGKISYVNFIESGYIEYIKKYIQSISPKIVHFKELVCEYNNNLLYKDMPHVEYIKIQLDVFGVVECKSNLNQLQSTMKGSLAYGV